MMPRISQRAPQACVPCTRRKMRCSKGIPCSNCIRRRISDQCCREDVLLSKTLARRKQAQTLTGENTPSILTPTPSNASTSSPKLYTGTMENDDSIHDESANERSQQGVEHSEHNSGEVLAMEAANTLESLAWGSHQSLAQPPADRIPWWETETLLTIEQEEAILHFHQENIAWTHNVLYLPKFIADYRRLRREGRLPHANWLASYYAIISVSLLYMSRSQADDLGLQDASSTAQDFYQLTLQSLQTCDSAMTHDITSLQAICIIVPCGHAFGDNKRVMNLLSTAICMAQVMGMHKLSREPKLSISPSELMDREVSKRVWCFLCIQDAYLISFKKSYIIHTIHNTTPLPTNCVDDWEALNEVGDIIHLPLDKPTHSSYMILQYEMTDIARWLYDGICSIENSSHTAHDIYGKVLEADAKLLDFGRGLPTWLKSDLPIHEENQLPSFVQNMRRTFRISFAHKRIKINRSFFCKSMTNRIFYYSAVACLSSAKSIVRTYCNTAPRFENEMWTCAPHVISACIILTLNLLFSPRHSDYTSYQAGIDTEADDQDFIAQCLSLLQNRIKHQSNDVVRRGIAVIKTLLDQSHVDGNKYHSLNSEEMMILVREVEENMRLEAVTIGVQIDDFGEDVLAWFRVD